MRMGLIFFPPHSFQSSTTPPLRTSSLALQSTHTSYKSYKLWQRKGYPRVQSHCHRCRVMLTFRTCSWSIQGGDNTTAPFFGMNRRHPSLRLISSVPFHANQHSGPAMISYPRITPEPLLTPFSCTQIRQASGNILRACVSANAVVRVCGNETLFRYLSVMSGDAL